MKFKTEFSEEKKIILISAAIVLLANLGALGMWAWGKQNTDGEGLTQLTRPGFGEGEREEEIIVAGEGEAQEIKVRIGEKEYTGEEAGRLLEETKKDLEKLIIGQNKSLDKVEYPMNLLTSYPDSPVQLSWSTDRPEILDWDGKIGVDTDKKGTKVCLRCELRLGEVTENWEENVIVWPEKVDARERIEREIQSAADAQETVSDTVKLPENIDGNEMIYSRKKDEKSIIMSIFGTAFGALVYPLWSSKKKEKIESRRALLQADYPDLVSKILLFLQAGLTVRNSVEKIVKDYLLTCSKNEKRRRPAYEELSAAFRELEGGMPEIRAYERFGNRCGTPEYKVLSVLLTQSIKKGNQGVLSLLEREAAAAMEERKRSAKIRGDQASTKLLAPMFIQLSIVMALLMVPAFLSFY